MSKWLEKWSKYPDGVVSLLEHHATAATMMFVFVSAEEEEAEAEAEEPPVSHSRQNM